MCLRVHASSFRLLPTCILPVMLPYSSREARVTFSDECTRREVSWIEKKKGFFLVKLAACLLGWKCRSTTLVLSDGWGGHFVWTPSALGGWIVLTFKVLWSFRLTFVFPFLKKISQQVSDWFLWEIIWDQLCLWSNPCKTNDFPINLEWTECMCCKQMLARWKSHKMVKMVNIKLALTFSAC